MSLSNNGLTDKEELSRALLENERLRTQNHELVGFGYGDDAYIKELESRIKLADAIVSLNRDWLDLVIRKAISETQLALKEAQQHERASIDEEAIILSVIRTW